MRKKITLTIMISVGIIFSLYFLISNKSMNGTKEINNKVFKMYLDDGNGNYNLSSGKTFPTKGYVLNTTKTSCDNGSKVTQNTDKSISTNLIGADACTLYFDKIEWNFDYTGEVQTFVVPKSGKYQLSIWGASGGTTFSFTHPEYYALGGNGGYSIGTINLEKNQNLYIVVGQKGFDSKNADSDILSKSFNGGTHAYFWEMDAWGGGGGATSIQTSLISDGQLWNYSEAKDKIVMVAGAGGGSGYNGNSGSTGIYKNDEVDRGGGSGGGFKGNSSLENSETYACAQSASGGTQTEGGTMTTASAADWCTPYTYKCSLFGRGCNASTKTIREGENGSGGGGGYYGGMGTWNRAGPASGGSGYIGNSLLTDKHMACYNCETSDEESTKTISVTCASETPTEDCAKIGNGYARITYLGAS